MTVTELMFNLYIDESSYNLIWHSFLTIYVAGKVY